jgi:hypothetical protein
VETRDPVSSAENAKPGLLVGSEGGDVIGEDARLKRPDAGSLALGNQLGHEGLPDALSTKCFSDIDDDLADAGVYRAL